MREAKGAEKRTEEAMIYEKEKILRKENFLREKKRGQNNGTLWLNVKGEKEGGNRGKKSEEKKRKKKERGRGREVRIQYNGTIWLNSDVEGGGGGRKTHQPNRGRSEIAPLFTLGGGRGVTLRTALPPSPLGGGGRGGGGRGGRGGGGRRASMGGGGGRGKK